MEQFSEKGESDVAALESSLLDYAVEKCLTLKDSQKNRNYLTYSLFSTAYYFSLIFHLQQIW